MIMEKSWNMTIFFQKSCNFVISHGIFPILPPNCTKLYFFGLHLEIEQRSRKSTFSGVFIKTPQIKNRGEKGSWKIKKWSWQSYGKVMEKYFVKSVGTLSTENNLKVVDHT